MCGLIRESKGRGKSNLVGRVAELPNLIGHVPFVPKSDGVVVRWFQPSSANRGRRRSCNCQSRCCWSSAAGCARASRLKSLPQGKAHRDSWRMPSAHPGVFRTVTGRSRIPEAGDQVSRSHVQPFERMSWLSAVNLCGCDSDPASLSLVFATRSRPCQPVGGLPVNTASWAAKARLKAVRASPRAR